MRLRSWGSTAAPPTGLPSGVAKRLPHHPFARGDRGPGALGRIGTSRPLGLDRLRIGREGGLPVEHRGQHHAQLVAEGTHHAQLSASSSGVTADAGMLSSITTTPSRT